MSNSSGRDRRTRGSAVTSGACSITIDGWSSRTSRAAGQK